MAHTTRENLAPQVIQRVARELRQLATSPPNGIRYLPQDEDSLTEIHVEIAGPENTPYDGGHFHIQLSLASGFPQTPPRGVFRTKIFHPNIAANGEICVNTLKRDWSSALGIAHVLQVIRCLLIVPFPESALNDEAGRLFMESYEEYARRAKLWTSIHAASASLKAVAVTRTAPTAGKGKDKEKENGLQYGVDAGDEPKVKAVAALEEETTTVAGVVVAPARRASPSSITTTAAASSTGDGFSGLVGSGGGKKRPSPTTMDARVAQKKKAIVKKGIKRL